MKSKDFGLSKEDIMEISDKYLLDIGCHFPIVIEEAEGCYVKDANGDEYLDFYAGIAVNSLGNCDKRIVDAVKEQAEQVMHVSLYPYNVPQAMLAKLICETTGFDRVFFQNSGSESNEAMIKMSRKYGVEKYGPEHYEIVTAKKSFHGRTFAALTATGQPETAIQKGFYPNVPGFKYVEFNNLESFKEAVTGNTTAIMVEPCQGEGGVYPATKEFLEGLRKLCDEKDILLLFDEVQTGWFRCGEAMAWMHYGVRPDAFSMAKALGGGLPLGGVVLTEKCAKTLNPGSHGCTFSGNPVCCAAGYAAINGMIEDKCGENSKKMGEYFREKLKTLPDVKEVRGLGLLVGVEFNDVDAVAVKVKAMENKLLVTATSNRIIRMVPPLIITEKECDKAVEILKKSVEEVMG